METMEITMDGKNYVPAEKYQELERDVEFLKRTVEEYEKRLHCAIELSDCRPITVAKALIDMDRLFYKDGTDYDGFTKKQLRQIAEHLLVYCNEGRK